MLVPKLTLNAPGRTGRAGREGDAITYFTDADAPYLKAYVTLSQSLLAILTG